MIAALMICKDRLEYSRKAYEALKNSDVDEIHIVYNPSNDGTYAWLKISVTGYGTLIHTGDGTIAGAFNLFLEQVSHWMKPAEFMIKVDNDTIIPPDFCARMLPHMQHADIVQARHKLIPASGVGTFDQWTSKMPAQGALRFNNFVGGTGVMMRRSVLTPWPTDTGLLMAWREWQRQNPNVKKAFATDVDITLLDEHGYGDYPDYYKQTGRL